MGYRYIYADDDGQGLHECPYCHKSLEEANSVRVEVVVLEKTREFFSALDMLGELEDVDALISNGYHSETFCGHCGKTLIEFEDQEEGYE